MGKERVVKEKKKKEDLERGKEETRPVISTTAHTGNASTLRISDGRERKRDFSNALLPSRSDEITSGRIADARGLRGHAYWARKQRILLFLA